MKSEEAAPFQGPPLLIFGPLRGERPGLLQRTESGVAALVYVEIGSATHALSSSLDRVIPSTSGSISRPRYSRDARAAGSGEEASGAVLRGAARARLRRCGRRR